MEQIEWDTNETDTYKNKDDIWEKQEYNVAIQKSYFMVKCGWKKGFAGQWNT